MRNNLDHFDTGFSWFAYAYKQMPRLFPRIKFAILASQLALPNWI